MGKSIVLCWDFTFCRHSCCGWGEDKKGSAGSGGFRGSDEDVRKTNTVMFCCSCLCGSNLIFFGIPLGQVSCFIRCGRFSNLVPQNQVSGSPFYTHTTLSSIHATFNHGICIGQKIICASSCSISSQRFNCVFFFLQTNGAFMGAINSSDPMFPLPLELRDTLKLDYDHPMSPYDKRSPLLLEYAQGLKALHVPEKLTLGEASSLMSIWKNENVLVGGKLFHFSI
jgi:hypothetical protein